RRRLGDRRARRLRQLGVGRRAEVREHREHVILFEREETARGGEEELPRINAGVDLGDDRRRVQFGRRGAAHGVVLCSVSHWRSRVMSCRTLPAPPSGGTGTSLSVSVIPPAFPIVSKMKRSRASTVRRSPAFSSSLMTKPFWSSTFNLIQAFSLATSVRCSPSSDAVCRASGFGA